MAKQHTANGVKVIILNKRSGVKTGKGGGAESDSELECLPDAVGKYAAQSKYVGDWKPSTKKEVEGLKRGGGVGDDLLKLLGETQPVLGRGAVRVACGPMSSDSCRRAVRDRLNHATSLKDRKEYFQSLRWVISSLGICRATQKRQKPIDGEMLDQTLRVYKEVRSLISAAHCGRAISPGTKSELEKHAHNHHNLGCQARERNELQQAMTQFQEVLKIRIQLVGEAHPETALARSRVATVIRDMGNLKGAMTELKQALKIQETALGEGHPHVAITRNNIGAVLKHQGKASEALKEHRKALVILVLYYGNVENKFIAEVHEHIGHALQLQGDTHGAHVEYTAALKIKRKVLGDTHAKTQRIVGKIKSLEGYWSGPAKSMFLQMEQEPSVEWCCPVCKWVTRLKVCSCCEYRMPLAKDDVPPIFKGCVVAFTGIIPKSCHSSAWLEWRLAEQRGARPTEEVDETVTHLVYREGYEKSVKVQQALQLSIKVLVADWFYQSINLGTHLDEAAFLAESSSSGKVITKRLRHQRPAGHPRGSSCPPLRCLLAPPHVKNYSRKEELPGPTPLVDQPAKSPRGLPPASPTAQRGLKVVPFEADTPGLNMSCYSMGSPLAMTGTGLSAFSNVEMSMESPSGGRLERLRSSAFTSVSMRPMSTTPLGGRSPAVVPLLHNLPSLIKTKGRHHSEPMVPIGGGGGVSEEIPIDAISVRSESQRSSVAGDDDADIRKIESPTCCGKEGEEEEEIDEEEEIEIGM